MKKQTFSQQPFPYSGPSVIKTFRIVYQSKKLNCNETNLSSAKIGSGPVCWELLQGLNGGRFFELDDGLPEDGVRYDGNDFIGCVLLDAPLHDAGQGAGVDRVVTANAGAPLELALSR